MSAVLSAFTNPYYWSGIGTAMCVVLVTETTLALLYDRRNPRNHPDPRNLLDTDTEPEPNP